MEAYLAPLLSLLRSRKFWIGVAGVVIPAVLNAFEVPAEVGESVMVIAVALITAITIEDSAAKSNGTHRASVNH